jgi:hypothetical protein
MNGDRSSRKQQKAIPEETAQYLFISYFVFLPLNSLFAFIFFWLPRSGLVQLLNSEFQYIGNLLTI